MLHYSKIIVIISYKNYHSTCIIILSENNYSQSIIYNLKSELNFWKYCNVIKIIIAGIVISRSY